VSKDFITTIRDGILLDLRVSPGARRSSVEGPYGESALKLKVADHPLDGKANAEAVRLLAEVLGVPHSDVSVVRGASSRDKVVLVRGVGGENIHEVLATHPR
jgi:uncharacterized protein (TIGR00251 family)